MIEEEKLFLHIEYKEPIDLLNFSSGLVSLQRLYVNLTGDNNSKLVIEEVKEGSIDIGFIIEHSGQLALAFISLQLVL